MIPLYTYFAASKLNITYPFNSDLDLTELFKTNRFLRVELL